MSTRGGAAGRGDSAALRGSHRGRGRGDRGGRLISTVPATPISSAATGDISPSTTPVSSTDVSAPTTACTPQLVKEANAQLDGFIASLNDNTDLTIKLDGYIWNVHADLISAHSPFFAAACNGQWKESQDRTIELHDDKPRIFARFLQFIYCQDYSNNVVGQRHPEIQKGPTMNKLLECNQTATYLTRREDSYDSYLIVHFQVYELADKYGCQGLQKLAQDNIGVNRGDVQIYIFRDMLHYQNLGAWREMFDKEEELKKIIAHKLAINYKKMKCWVEEHKGSCLLLKEWFRWMEEDSVFCMMVVDAMSEQF